MTASDVSGSRSGPVMGAELRPWLRVVLVLFGVLVVNSVYLGGVTLAEQVVGRSLQDYFYLSMFLAHLLLGLGLIVPFLYLAVAHLRRAVHRPNRYAVRAGLGLFASGLVLIVSGILLTRFGFFEINDPRVREVAYWLHVATPFLVVWLFVLHRLAGPRIRWRPGLAWGGVAVAFTAVALVAHLTAAQEAKTVDERPFFPALTQLAGGATGIAPERLMTDKVCAECHGDIAKQAGQSMHRLSSFNNPAYRVSVEETREVVLKRDGSLGASAFCAACHDPVPLFSGRFLSTAFDPDRDATAHAGITCVTCHAITHVNSTRGNGDYTLADPANYPFDGARHALLAYLNRQLIKAKPELHKKTFLKPLHRSAEFCSTCHKVHLPKELNHYKWLRGQNHYDSYLLSGVSGHRVDSFYYPPKAVPNCSQCHMPPVPSEDPAARDFDGKGRRSVHHHGFLTANTAVPQLLGLPESVNAEKVRFLTGVTRVDLFGIKADGSIEGELHAPLRPELPSLEPGKRYLLETVIRTLKVGHPLTQGTADSNELWLEVTVRDSERLIAHSGAIDPRGDVDRSAYFANAYVLDKHGNRIARRNVQDIFVPLYDHQVPPGAASVVHYALAVPQDARGPLVIEARLNYRKFDADYYRFLRGDPAARNDFPVVILASDRVELPVGGGAAAQTSTVAEWERWNDYGIGLLRQGDSGSNKGELRQAEAAFLQVERLGRGDGPLNLARVYYKEGRLADASAALKRAAASDPPAPPWTVAWFTALVDKQRGNLDAAIETFEAIADTRFANARERGFDFSYDTNLLNELGRTLYERSRQSRGAAGRDERKAFLTRARTWLDRVLEIDAENAAAHYNLSLVHAELGDKEAAARHRERHETYRPDDQAVARAVTLHRSRNPVADHAASPIAIYELKPAGQTELASSGP